jgi:hypothetical protein
VVWERIGPVDGPSFQYALTLERAGHAPIRIHPFERDVDVYWDTDSRHFAVTDFEGSNVADCFLYDVQAPWRAISIGEALPALPESAANAHFYVRCEGWQGDRQLRVVVTGHTDIAPAYAFAYRFLYDIGNRHVVPIDPQHSGRIDQTGPR